MLTNPLKYWFLEANIRKLFTTRTQMRTTGTATFVCLKRTRKTTPFVFAICASLLSIRAAIAGTCTSKTPMTKILGTALGATFFCISRRLRASRFAKTSCRNVCFVTTSRVLWLTYKAKSGSTMYASTGTMRSGSRKTTLNSKTLVAHLTSAGSTWLAASAICNKDHALNATFLRAGSRSMSAVPSTKGLFKARKKWQKLRNLRNGKLRSSARSIQSSARTKLTRWNGNKTRNHTMTTVTSRMKVTEAAKWRDATHSLSGSRSSTKSTLTASSKRSRKITLGCLDSKSSSRLVWMPSRQAKGKK